MYRTSLKPILVVDDDQSVRDVLKSALAADGFDVVVAVDAADCLDKVKYAPPRLVLLDISIPEGMGLNVLRDLQSAQVAVPIVVITAEGDVESAALAARFGARDSLSKPIDPLRLRKVVERSLGAELDRSNREASALVPARCRDNLVGSSRTMQEVIKAIGRVACQDLPVLIRGEPGTGKEQVARAIWRHSDRSDRAFIRFDCTTGHDEFLEFELFGRDARATQSKDALSCHVGCLEICDGGTIFLDEIGALPLPIQAKLLRVLQQRHLFRVGGNREIPLDVRVVSATSRPLEAIAEQGGFREDLLHRLNGFTIQLPPVRERASDIPILLADILFRFNERLNKNITAITGKAAQRLQRYAWPGNVAEMEAMLSLMMLKAEGQVIDSRDLPACVTSSSDGPHVGWEPSLSSPVSPGSSGDELCEFVEGLISRDTNNVYADALAYVERMVLTKVLQKTAGNQTAAARRLGITRGSLRYKLKQHGLSISNQVACETNVSSKS